MKRLIPFHRLIYTVLLVLPALLAGCEAADEESAEAQEVAPEQMTNRIDVPPGVRRNLGITFAEVERRPVQRTRRIPGEFELKPDAARDHRVMLPGRIELMVDQYERVEAGQVLFRIDSPRWQELRHEVVEAEGEITLAEARLDVSRAAAKEVSEELAFVEDRLERLDAANVRRVELEADQAELTSRLPRLEAEVQAKEVELDEAREHYDSILKVAASVTNISVEQLLEAVETQEDEHGHEQVRWRSLARIEVRAEQAGVVQTLAVSQGEWGETGDRVMRVVNPEALRFRAAAPQADITEFADGQAVRIVPPQGGSVGLQDAMNGVLKLGVEGDAGERTVPVYGLPEEVSRWARPGVSGYMEVFVEGDDLPELAIPVSSLVRDGLRTIFYRRDPDDPNQVYPVDADLGTEDGRWVVVRSGVTDGDEVVLNGAYALTMAGGEQQAPPGYHYHADGTLHKDH